MSISINVALHSPSAIKLMSAVHNGECNELPAELFDVLCDIANSIEWALEGIAEMEKAAAEDAAREARNAAKGPDEYLEF